MPLTVAELNAILEADIRPLQSALTEAGQRIQQLEGKVNNASQSMNYGWRILSSDLMRYVSLPLGLAGAAALKMSVDFEDAFAKIEGLTSVSGAALDAMRQKVLDLSSATGKGPQELAEAAYFIASSGVEGAAALDALEVSAKAAAAGLGETKFIADAVTSAMNAYKGEGLSAASATDTLVAAVREGKGEADAFAKTIGFVVPMASELGVSFEEVAAAMAAMTRIGMSAQTASTSLRQVLAAIFRPTQMATEAMAEYGLSAEGLRRQLDEEGLLATLTRMKDATRGDEEAFISMLGRVNGVTGALALVGDAAGETAGVFERMADTTGSMEQAFDTASQTSGFKMRQAFADIQQAAIHLGDSFAPIAASVAKGAAGIAEAFGNLTPEAQKALVGIAGGLALLGPGIKVAQDLRIAWAALSSTMTLSGGVMAAAIGSVAVLAVQTFANHQKNARIAAEQQEQFTQVMRDAQDPTQALIDKYNALVEAMPKVAKGAAEGAEAVKAAEADYLAAQAAARGLTGEFAQLGLGLETINRAAMDGGSGLNTLLVTLDGTPGSMQRARASMEELTTAQQQVATAILDQVESGALSARQAQELGAALGNVTRRTEEQTRALGEAAKRYVEESVLRNPAIKSIVDEAMARSTATDELGRYIDVGQRLQSIQQDWLSIDFPGVVQAEAAAVEQGARAHYDAATAVAAHKEWLDSLVTSYTNTFEAALRSVRAEDNFSAALARLDSTSRSTGSSVSSNASRMASATDALTAARERLGRAEESVNEAMAEAEERTARAQRDAQRSLEDADRRVASSMKSRGRLEEDLAKEREEILSDSARRAADLEERRNAVLGGRGVRKSEKIKAEADYQDALADLAGETDRRLAELEEESVRRRESAAEDVADAERQSARAREDVSTRLADVAKQNEDRIAAAKQAVIDANRNVEASERGIAQAAEGASRRIIGAHDSVAESSRKNLEIIDNAAKVAFDTIKEMIEQQAPVDDVKKKTDEYADRIREAGLTHGVAADKVNLYAEALERSARAYWLNTMGLSARAYVVEQAGAGNTEGALRAARAANPQEFFGTRASGGPVQPYATYRINENGTELLTMGSKSGYITPAGRGGAGGGGVVNHITINLPPGSNGEDVVAAIRRYELSNGSSWRSNSGWSG